MLPRPSLLLVPADIRSTDTAVQAAKARPLFRVDAPAAAAGYGMRGKGGKGLGKGGAKRYRMVIHDNHNSFAFLPAGAGVIAVNLKPDAHGRVTVPLAALGGAPSGVVEAVAVDMYGCVSRRMNVAALAAAPRDLRLKSTLEMEKHYTEQVCGSDCVGVIVCV